jgi:hypothetical protein
VQWRRRKRSQWKENGSTRIRSVNFENIPIEDDRGVWRTPIAIGCHGER